MYTYNCNIVTLQHCKVYIVISSRRQTGSEEVETIFIHSIQCFCGSWNQIESNQLYCAQTKIHSFHSFYPMFFVEAGMTKKTTDFYHLLVNSIIPTCIILNAIPVKAGPLLYTLPSISHQSRQTDTHNSPLIPFILTI